ncbi:hypothetical protein DM01DRAFT_324387 [Hesseltinella vesiculosa]|uniref:Uncharacterized protein n=1 Tax=Hesseltinella vesiculosa TaxID=101127 RepID=A0A1X2GJL3_9FUNG|nr:hypothetical protein DM01DRAFT_324387 [Hesseltinella vesiculosa]
MFSQSLILAAFLAIAVSGESYDHAVIKYYDPKDGLSSTLCNLDFYNRRTLDLPSMDELLYVDPLIHCEGEETLPYGDNAASCTMGSPDAPLACETVKRVCEDGMRGKMEIGACATVPSPERNCCFTMQSPNGKGLWKKHTTGGCPYMCSGIADLSEGEWCKSCSCLNPESGEDEASYNGLC